MSLTDPDARLLVKSGQGVAGYNVQVVVDDKHKLIIASEVVNDSSDVGQLHAMAKAAKEALDAEALQVLADEGYYSSTELKACEDDGIKAYVPVPKGNRQIEKKGRFSLKDFSYDPAADAYRCPAGELLRPMEGRWENTSGRIEIRYASSTKICGVPVKGALPEPDGISADHRPLGTRRRSRTSSRADARGASELMRRRSGIVEHPFGTLKCRAGYRHFLVRGLDKVRGEWSLMALCYNFTRVLNILGFEGFVTSMAKAFGRDLPARSAPAGCLKLLVDAFWTNMPAWPPIRRSGLLPRDDQHYLPSLDGQITENLSSPSRKNIPLHLSGKSVI